MSNLGDNSENLSMAVKPKNKRTKIIIVLFLVIAIAGFAIFWLTASDEFKDGLRGKAQETMPENALETITSVIAKPSSPPMGNNENVVKMDVESVITQNDTQNIITDPSIEENVGSSIMPNMIAPVQEDSVVSANFLDDLAELMVSRYNPKDNSIDLGIKSLNVHYGTSLKGLNYEGQDFFTGREYILRYIFSPSMVSGLYKLYANKFINKIVEVAMQPKEGKALSKEQLNAMFMTYSKDISSLSVIMANISTLTDLKGKIANIQEINQKTTDMQVKMNETIFALDEEREAGNSTSDKYKELEAEVNALSGQQVKLSRERADVHRGFAQSIRGESTLKDVDDEMLIYVAYWVNRRLETQADALKAVSVASKVLNDLSNLLKKNATN